MASWHATSRTNGWMKKYKSMRIWDCGCAVTAKNLKAGFQFHTHTHTQTGIDGSVGVCVAGVCLSLYPSLPLSFSNEKVTPVAIDSQFNKNNNNHDEERKQRIACARHQ